MRKLLFTAVTTFFVLSTYAQNNQQLAILNKFITIHNLGTEKAIGQFIKETYNPGLYDRIDLKKHIEFYDQIIKEFGALNDVVYKIEEEKPYKVIVHLIKKNESFLNQNIDPTEILVVEIDISKEMPRYLSRGLGLGALVCEIRKKE